MKMGYVYLIEDNENGLYKIGVTRGSVEKRLSHLQTGSALHLYIKEAFKTDYPFKLEKMLHNCYKDRHYSNEWYWLDEADLKGFRLQCEKYQRIINALRDNPFF